MSRVKMRIRDYLLLGIGATALMYQSACFPRYIKNGDTNITTLNFGGNRELSDVIELDTNKGTKYYKIFYDRNRENIDSLKQFDRVIIDLNDNSVEIVR
ncbi:MAG: hypothetical protein AB1571_03035 [Nanoarchaeota archaeon]